MLSLFTILRNGPQKVGLKPGEVTLTFDDGPNLEDNVTPNLLNVLHQHSVNAGFCVVGKQVRKHPDVIRRMERSGHLLINHTEDHHHPVRQSFTSLVNEIRSCDDSIAEALGVTEYRSQFFRVPFGIVTWAVRRVTRQLDLIPALVSHYGWDTRLGPHNYHQMIDTLIENAKRHSGGMYVLHDGSLYSQKIIEPDWARSAENRSWIPDAVDRIITELKSAGMQFVVPDTAPVFPDTRQIEAAA